MIKIIIIVITVLILIKTGSIGKAFSFFFKWPVFPGLIICGFALVGYFIGQKSGCTIGTIIGVIACLIWTIKHIGKGISQTRGDE